MAELRFCKPAVVGSTPTASSVLKFVVARALRRRDVGGVPERPMGPDCKSGGNAFAGSNPAAPTRFAGWTCPTGVLFSSLAGLSVAFKIELTSVSEVLGRSDESAAAGSQTRV